MPSIRLKKIGACLGCVIMLSVSSFSVIADDKFSNYVDEKGNINFPHSFRTNMVHLGSWFVPEGGASGFHDVYTEKKSVESFRKSGKFPDGATIVKELRVSNAGSYTTGAGVSYATKDIKQWFVMIKDVKGRFADNPLWGDGWGWALYKPDDKDKNLATNYKTDCLSCHKPVEHKDWIYTEAYPSLSKE
jgi:hypothetical protein